MRPAVRNTTEIIKNLITLKIKGGAEKNNKPPLAERLSWEQITEKRRAESRGGKGEKYNEEPKVSPRLIGQADHGSNYALSSSWAYIYIPAMEFHDGNVGRARAQKCASNDRRSRSLSLLSRLQTQYIGLQALLQYNLGLGWPAGPRKVRSSLHCRVACAHESMTWLLCAAIACIASVIIRRCGRMPCRVYNI